MKIIDKKNRLSRSFTNPAGLKDFSENNNVINNNSPINGIDENKILFHILLNFLFFKSQSKDSHNIRMCNGATITG